MMLDWSQWQAVERVPGKVGGSVGIPGDPVPVKALFENLEDGARVDDICNGSRVTRAQIENSFFGTRRSKPRGNLNDSFE